MDFFILSLLLVTVDISESTIMRSGILQASTRLSSLDDDKKEISVHIESHKDFKQTLKQVQIPRHKSHSRQSSETEGILVSDDGTTTCRENCVDGADCDTLENEPEGYVHRCAYDPQLRRLPLYCKNRQGNLCYGQTVVYDRTPCTPAGTTFTDRVCSRGECVQAFELCPAEIQVQQRASRRPYRARGPARPSNRQPACSRGGY